MDDKYVNNPLFKSLSFCFVIINVNYNKWEGLKDGHEFHDWFLINTSSFCKLN